MGLEFSFGPMSLADWQELQNEVAKSDRAEEFPAILLYPHGDVEQKDVEAELEEWHSQQSADEPEKQFDIETKAFLKAQAIPFEDFEEGSVEPTGPGEKLQTPEPKDPGGPHRDKESGLRLFARDFDTAPITELPIDQLISTQNTVYASKVQEYMQNPVAEGLDHGGNLPRVAPMVYRFRGKYYIWDGHHRLVAMRALGYPTAKCKFIDCDAPDADYSEKTAKERKRGPREVGYRTEKVREGNAYVATTAAKAVKEIIHFGDGDFGAVLEGSADELIDNIMEIAEHLEEGGIKKEWIPDKAKRGPNAGKMGWRNTATGQWQLEKPTESSTKPLSAFPELGIDPDSWQPGERPEAKPEPKGTQQRFPIELESPISDKLWEHGHEGYIVGGSVRDSLLGRTPKDVDITTDARPEEVIQLFEEAGYKVIPTGLQHGTVTIMDPEQGPVEVTTFRTEGKYVEGRRPESVEFVKDVKEDLGRRDFTINAMAYDTKNKKLVDPHGGSDDLSNGVIRAVGNPIDRFTEDGLRPIRAARFAGTLGFSIDPKTKEAMGDKNVHATVSQVAQERIREESVKAMRGKKPRAFIENLMDTGLIDFVVPEIKQMKGMDQPKKYHKHDVLEHSIRTMEELPPEDPVLRLVGLLHDVGKPVSRGSKEDGTPTYHRHDEHGSKMIEDIMRRMKFSNEDIDRAKVLVRNHLLNYDKDATSDAAIRRMMGRVGEKNFKDLVALRRADLLAHDKKEAAEHAASLDHLMVRVKELGAHAVTPKLAVSGHDVMALGVPEGPEVRTVLEHLKELVTDDPSKNNRDALLAAARRHLGKLFYGKPIEWRCHLAKAGGTYCDLPGHCFPSRQALAGHVGRTQHPLPPKAKLPKPPSLRKYPLEHGVHISQNSNYAASVEMAKRGKVHRFLAGIIEESKKDLASKGVTFKTNGWGTDADTAPNPQKVRYSLHAELTDSKTGQSIGYMKRSLYYDDFMGQKGGWVLHRDIFDVNDERKAQGIGSTLEYVMVRRAQGLANKTKKPVLIEMYANINIGGYAWARYGYNTKVPSRSLLGHLRSRLDQAYTRDWITQEQHAQGEKALSAYSSGREDLSTIADLGRGAFIDFKNDEPHWISGTRGAAERGVHLGKYLLLGTSWGGQLLVNPLARTRKQKIVDEVRKEFEEIQRQRGPAGAEDLPWRR